MSFANMVDRRIWWLTVSKAVGRSSKISIEDLESALASLRASTTESKAVSVVCPHFSTAPMMIVVEEVVFCGEKRQRLVWTVLIQVCFAIERTKGKLVSQFSNSRDWLRVGVSCKLGFYMRLVYYASEGKTTVWRDCVHDREWGRWSAV